MCSSFGSWWSGGGAMKSSRSGYFSRLASGYNFSFHPTFALWLKYKTPFSSIIYFTCHLCPSFGSWWSGGGAIKSSHSCNFSRLTSGYNFSLHPMFALWLKYKTPFFSILNFTCHMYPSFGSWWSEGGAMKSSQSGNFSRLASGHDFSLHPMFALW